MYACKLICNLYKEHWILENSCVTPSFPSLSSLLFFLFLFFLFLFPLLGDYSLCRVCGCLSDLTYRQADVPRSTQTTPRAVFIVTLPAFYPTPLFDPFVTFASPKSGLQMTWLDCGELANMLRQLEHVTAWTSKEMCQLFWLPCVCRQLGWTTGVHRVANCGNFKRCYNISY